MKSEEKQRNVKNKEKACFFNAFVLVYISICNVGRGKHWLVPFA